MEQVLVNAGVAGAVLAWFMFRAERRFENLEAGLRQIIEELRRLNGRS